jgi:hypothetical protein
MSFIARFGVIPEAALADARASDRVFGNPLEQIAWEGLGHAPALRCFGVLGARTAVGLTAERASRGVAFRNLIRTHLRHLSQIQKPPKDTRAIEARAGRSAAVNVSETDENQHRLPEADNGKLPSATCQALTLSS